MYKMSSLDKTTVIRTILYLHKSRVCVWEGISDSAIATIRVKPDTNKARDLLITGLDSNERIALYFSSLASPKHVSKWDKTNTYFRNVLIVAKALWK
jgi:hypothetical protein